MKNKNKMMLGLAATSIIGKVAETLNTKDNVTPNVQTTFNIDKDNPLVDLTSYIHHYASVIGSVRLEKETFVGPFSSIRGDEGLKIHIGEKTNIQDGVVIHGLKNFEFGSNIVATSVFKENKPFSVHIGDRCTLAPQCQVHGPALIASNVYIGMQALIFDSYVEENVIVEPAAKVIGVTIPKDRYVPSGRTISTQDEANELPEITDDYRYRDMNKNSLDAYKELTLKYRKDSQ